LQIKITSTDGNQSHRRVGGHDAGHGAAPVVARLTAQGHRNPATSSCSMEPMTYVEHPRPNTPRNERKIAGAILACWSLVHGLTMLLADGLVGPRKKSDALGDSVVQGMLDGLASKLPALPPGTWVGPQV
jgi:hypothetical protein